jgi:hypothetical protein
MKKCKKCGAPLEGFLYNTIGKLMGIKPSEQDPEICNKCEEGAKTEAQPGIKPEPSQPAAQEPVMPAEEKKDEENQTQA